jgi:segregation and condensation protein B
MELRPEFSALRDRFYGRIKAAKLSQNVVDVLAIVSYKQPISKNELEAIRGKPSSGILSQLVRRQLLQLVRENEPDEELGDEGDSKTKKRRRKKTAAHYYTTSRFLQVFGLSSLDDLPRSDEIDRLS